MKADFLKKLKWSWKCEHICNRPRRQKYYPGSSFSVSLYNFLKQLNYGMTNKFFNQEKKCFVNTSRF